MRASLRRLLGRMRETGSRKARPWRRRDRDMSLYKRQAAGDGVRDTMSHRPQELHFARSRSWKRIAGKRARWRRTRHAGPQCVAHREGEVSQVPRLLSSEPRPGEGTIEGVPRQRFRSIRGAGHVLAVMCQEGFIYRSGRTISSGVLMLRRSRTSTICFSGESDRRRTLSSWKRTGISV